VYERATDRDALAHAAGELIGIAIGECADTDLVEDCECFIALRRRGLTANLEL
jgi:hypothetical protein